MRNQTIESQKKPIESVNMNDGIADGYGGGKPPDRTMVAERNMNSIPSVVIQEGMLKNVVMTPLLIPQATATPSATTMAKPGGTPALIRMTATIGVRPKTAPTERSN